MRAVVVGSQCGRDSTGRDVPKNRAQLYRAKLEQYLQARPEDATELGDHRFDGELTDYSAEELAKWKQARLTSAQLSTYFVAAPEHLDMRAAEQKKLGTGFNLKKYNDQVISYGPPPMKYGRELMAL